MNRQDDERQEDEHQEEQRQNLPLCPEVPDELRRLPQRWQAFKAKFAPVTNAFSAIVSHEAFLGYYYGLSIILIFSLDLIALWDDRPYWWTVIPFGICLVGAFRAYTLPQWEGRRGLVKQLAVQAFALALTWVSGGIALRTIITMIMELNQLEVAPVGPVPEVSLGPLLTGCL